MDKDTFLQYLEGTKPIGHLLIAYIAMLSISTVDINFQFLDGEESSYPTEIIGLLKRILLTKLYEEKTL
jgi:hypothetical protein